MYTPSEFEDKEFQALFEEELAKVKETNSLISEKNKQHIQELKDKGEYKEPTEAEIREDLQMYIYDEYKSVHGIKGRFFDFDSMSMKELQNVADRLGDEIDLSIAYEQAEERQYQELLEKAKNTEGAVISKNPEFDEHFEKGNSGIDYGGNRQYNIYVPNEDEEPKNSFADAFKNAKPLKKRNRP